MGQGSSPTERGEKAQHAMQKEKAIKQLFVHRKAAMGNVNLKQWKGGTPREDRKTAGEHYDQIDCWKKCFGRDRFVFAD